MHPFRIWRQSIGATLSDVAGRMGCSSPMIHYWETGKRVVAPLDELKWKMVLSDLQAQAERRRREALE